MKLATMMRISFALAFAIAGCSTAYIPNTEVEDTAQNRKVISFCEEYRHAVEDKNVARLLAMASPQYHEDASTPSGDDDMDLEGLKAYLTGMFQQTDQIRYEIKYRRVTFSESGHIWVDYTYAASYRLPGLKGAEWRHTVADNRLDLVRDGDSFKIVAGM
jgi:hypothetical protein